MDCAHDSVVCNSNICLQIDVELYSIPCLFVVVLFLFCFLHLLS